MIVAYDIDQEFPDVSIALHSTKVASTDKHRSAENQRCSELQVSFAYLATPSVTQLLPALKWMPSIKLSCKSKLLAYVNVITPPFYIRTNGKRVISLCACVNTLHYLNQAFRGESIDITWLSEDFSPVILSQCKWGWSFKIKYEYPLRLQSLLTMVINNQHHPHF